MRFKKIVLRCECGRLASRIHEAGLTPGHELVFAWWCTGCKRHIFSIKAEGPISGPKITEALESAADDDFGLTPPV